MTHAFVFADTVGNALGGAVAPWLEDFTNKCSPLVRPPSNNHFPPDCAHAYDCRDGNPVMVTGCIETVNWGVDCAPHRTVEAMSNTIPAITYLAMCLGMAPVSFRRILRCGRRLGALGHAVPDPSEN